MKIFSIYKIVRIMIFFICGQLMQLQPRKRMLEIFHLCQKMVKLKFKPRLKMNRYVLMFNIKTLVQCLEFYFTLASFIKLFSLKIYVFNYSNGIPVSYNSTWQRAFDNKKHPVTKILRDLWGEHSLQHRNANNNDMILALVTLVLWEEPNVGVAIGWWK